VRDQIAHLATSEEGAALAASDADAFGRHLVAALADVDGVEREMVRRARAATPLELLAWWRSQRELTLEALAARAPDDRIPWAADEMSTMSFATARLMETWAHGQDVVDALGIRREPTARLRHIATLGVMTRRFSYVLHGLREPADDVRVELEGPGGERWTWGAPDAPASVTGDALGFCLVVTQRRRLDETGLEAEGSAREWLGIAQAFAGPPTARR